MFIYGKAKRIFVGILTFVILRSISCAILSRARLSGQPEMYHHVDDYQLRIQILLS